MHRLIKAKYCKVYGVLSITCVLLFAVFMFYNSSATIPTISIVLALFNITAIIVCIALWMLTIPLVNNPDFYTSKQ